MKSLEELKALRDQARMQMGIREGNDDNTRVLVGMATCGIAAGARAVLGAFVEEVAKENVKDIMISQTGCIGICQFEPVVEVCSADGVKTTYVNMTPEKSVKVVHQHLINGKPVVEYTIGAAKEQ